MDFAESSLVATGTQLGTEPVPYRLDYELRTGPSFVTEILNVEVTAERWARRLRLLRRPDGTWDCDAGQHGDPALPPAGGDVTAVAGARDCDLAWSPLTNLMPIRRHRLHQRPGGADLLMAWVSVPDLALHASEQRYEHVRRGAEHSIVRFRARDPEFVADLVVDGDGIVTLYPDLARRLNAEVGNS